MINLGYAPGGIASSLANGGGSVVPDGTGNLTVTVKANSATGWIVQDTAFNSYWATDTRTATDGVSAHSIGNPNISFLSAAGNKFHQVVNTTFTLTLTGSNPVTALNGVGMAIQAPTITSAGTPAIANASTLSISGAPTVTGTATVTNNYALDVVAGATHFGTASIGIGGDASLGRVLNISGALTTNPAAGQHGILMSLTSDGTFTNELVMMKVTLSGSTAAANTVARAGGFNVGTVVLPSGDTFQKWVAFSIDGSSGLGAGVITNQYYGADMGSVTSPAITITDGSGSGNPTGLFVGYRVGAWAVTGSGTTNEYDGVLVKAPTLTTVATAYGLKIESISGATQGTSPTSFAINTAAGAVSLTVGTTISSNAASVWDGLSIPASTLTLTGTTTVSGTNPGLNLVTIYQPTVSGASAVSVSGTAATMTLTGAPLQAGAGPATLQNVRILNLATANTTIRNVAQSTYYALGVAAHQVILSQTTGMVNTNGIAAVTLDQITVNQTGGAVTVTNAATLNIVGPPIQGTATLTNIWALRVQAGTAFFGGTLAVNAGLTLNYRTAAIADAILTTDTLLVYTGGPYTATLPTAVGVTGKVYMIKAPTGAANNITIATTSAQTIDGAATLVLNANNEAALLVSDGANWKVMSDAATTIL